MKVLVVLEIAVHLFQTWAKLKGGTNSFFLGLENFGLRYNQEQYLVHTSN